MFIFDERPFAPFFPFPFPASLSFSSLSFLPLFFFGGGREEQGEIKLGAGKEGRAVRCSVRVNFSFSLRGKAAPQLSPPPFYFPSSHRRKEGEGSGNGGRRTTKGICSPFPALLLFSIIITILFHLLDAAQSRQRTKKKKRREGR